VALARARAVAAVDPARLDESIAVVQSIEADARRSGVVDDVLEAEFTLCELEKQGRRPKTNAHLAALAKDARGRGYLAIARRADALAKLPAASSKQSAAMNVPTGNRRGE
jgi:hypothetical protein